MGEFVESVEGISEASIEKNIGETILKLIENKLIVSCHDVSLGGILTAVSKNVYKKDKKV